MVDAESQRKCDKGQKNDRGISNELKEARCRDQQGGESSRKTRIRNIHVDKLKRLASYFIFLSSCMFMSTRCKLTTTETQKMDDVGDVD
jgi:hypothetical protein